MGRKTFESIGNPLPERVNLVVSRNEDFNVSGIIVCRSIEEAVRRARNYGRIYVVGGQKVYEQTIERATRLEITEIHRDFEGDTFFPEIDKNAWRESKREDKEVYSFVSYVRR
jgi:dihydrofolate reductase